MTVVVDASLIAAALLDVGSASAWAEEVLVAGPLSAPAHMPVEAASILRRAALSGDVTDDAASLAHRDLCALPIELFPYAATAARSWELRGNVTGYDAAYVALAGALDSPLATLDLRLSRAPGSRCAFLVPP